MDRIPGNRVGWLAWARSAWRSSLGLIGKEVPSLRAAGSPASTSTPGLKRRRVLVGIAAFSALVGGVFVQRLRGAARVGDVAGVTVHAHPRDLPQLRFSSGTGAPLDLAAFRGRAVLLNIWATWCGPCREEMPALDRLQGLLGSPRFEVVTLSIDANGIAAVQPFFAEIGIRHLQPYLDSFREAGVLVATGVPFTLLIDAQGREVARKLGAARWDEPAIQDLIRLYLPAHERVNESKT